MGGTFENAGRRVDQAINKGREIGKRAVNSIKDKVNNGVRNIQEYGRSVANRAGKAYENAKNKVNSAVEKGKEYINNNINNIKKASNVIGNKAKSIVEAAGNYGEKAGYILYGAALVFGNNVNNITYKAKTGIVNIILKTGESININITKPAINSLNAAKNYINTQYESVKERGKIIKENATNEITKIKNKLDQKRKIIANKIEAEINKIKRINDWVLKNSLTALSNFKGDVERAGNAILASLNYYGNKVSNFVVNNTNNTIKLVLTTGKEIHLDLKNQAWATIDGGKKTLAKLEKIGRTGRVS